MVTLWVMVGRGESREMVATPSPVVFTLKLMVSAPGVALASWMAALKVQNAPKLTTLHVPLPGLASALSSDRLTVKVVEACTGLAAEITTNKLASIASATIAVIALK
jgi:hypothetical protein